MNVPLWAFAIAAAAVVILPLVWLAVRPLRGPMPNWPPRDWRKLLAMLLLSGGGMAMTIFAWRALTLTADRSPGPWPVAYALYGILGLIFTVFTALGWVISKSKSDLDLPGGVKYVTSGGEDDDAPAAAAAVAGAAVDKAGEIAAQAGQ